jgi:hypothetical protein
MTYEIHRQIDRTWKLENIILSEVTQSQKWILAKKKKKKKSSDTTHRPYKIQQGDETKVWMLQSYLEGGRK